MGHAVLKEDLAPPPGRFRTEMPVGDILRRARLHYDRSIADIEKAIRIRASQIEAIEQGRLDELPGRVYAIGFVRSYAEYLGLDADRMVRLFKEQSAGVVKEKPELHFPVAASESKLPAIWIILFSLVAAFAVIVVWSYMHVEDRSMVTEVPPVPPALQAELEAEIIKEAEARIPYGPPAPTPAQMASAVEAPKAEPGIILNITANSWVEISDDTGKKIVSKVLKAGDQYFVPDSPNLKMSLGNAGGVAVTLDGEPLPSLGSSGQIRRNIPLGRAALQNLQTGLE
ncbi:MAG: hypothetical protein DHS20C02_03830 [Micavibrio sp.]|nr:MAG: hypothetical protein DHS20C02_03830 [Micavibrio sp.]